MIKKSLGLTQTEKILAELCDKTFLKLWSYPNPFTENHKEICDLLVVFEDDVFIFFVREKNLNPLVSESGLIYWERWKRTVIDKQIITCYGAERYLRSGKKIFLDQSGKEPFPLEFKKDKVNIYKIIIAHGAEHACKEMSQDNINGSLAISYCDSKIFDKPFCITLSRENPIHILDSFNIGIILQELDTICDFRWYLEEKENAIKKYSILA